MNLEIKKTSITKKALNFTKAGIFMLFIFCNFIAFTQSSHSKPKSNSHEKYLRLSKIIQQKNANLAIVSSTENSKLGKKANKQKLDNILEEEYDGTKYSKTDKTDYVYDANGRVTSQVSYNWEINKWTEDEKTLNTWDSKGNVTKIEFLLWNSSLKKFETYTIETFTYDANNNKLTYIFSLRDNNLQMVINDRQNEYTYDAKNNLLSDVFYRWDKTSSKFILESKELFTYNSMDLVTQQLNVEWDTNLKTWKNAEKITASFNANNKPVLLVHLDWNSTSQAYDTSGKIVLNYDSKSNLLTNIVNIYTEDMKWIEYLKEQYTYDANNNMLSLIYSEYDEDIESLLFYEKITLTYDIKNNKVSEVYFDWDDSENKWIATEKSDYTVDNNLAKDQLILPSIEYYYSNFQTKLLYEINSTWDEATTKWEIYTKSTFNYSDFLSGNIFKIRNNLTLSVYPNPASNKVNVNVEGQLGELNVKVSDISGKFVIGEALNADRNIDISDLKNGVYFIEVYNDLGLLGTSKLVKCD